MLAVIQEALMRGLQCRANFPALNRVRKSCATIPNSIPRRPKPKRLVGRKTECSGKTLPFQSGLDRQLDKPIVDHQHIRIGNDINGEQRLDCLA